MKKVIYLKKCFNEKGKQFERLLLNILVLSC